MLKPQETVFLAYLSGIETYLGISQSTVNGKFLAYLSGIETEKVEILNRISIMVFSLPIRN